MGWLGIEKRSRGQAREIREKPSTRKIIFQKPLAGLPFFISRLHSSVSYPRTAESWRKRAQCVRGSRFLEASSTSSPSPETYPLDLVARRRLTRISSFQIFVQFQTFPPFLCFFSFFLSEQHRVIKWLDFASLTNWLPGEPCVLSTVARKSLFS